MTVFFRKKCYHPFVHIEDRSHKMRTWAAHGCGVVGVLALVSGTALVILGLLRICNVLELRSIHGWKLLGPGMALQVTCLALICLGEKIEPSKKSNTNPKRPGDPVRPQPTPQERLTTEEGKTALLPLEIWGQSIFPLVIGAGGNRKERLQRLYNLRAVNREFYAAVKLYLPYLLPEVILPRSLPEIIQHGWTFDSEHAEAILARQSQFPHRQYGEISSVCLSGRRRLPGRVHCVACSPTDPRLIATAGADGKVRIWDIATGKCTVFYGHTHIVRAVAFSPDGRSLATASDDKTVCLWNIAEQRCYRRNQVGFNKANVLCFSGNDILFCGSQSGAVYKLHSIYATVALGHHQDSVSAIACFTLGNCLASGGRDALIYIWDAQTYVHQGVFRGHSREITDLAFSRDGTTLASASEDGTVAVWDMDRRVVRWSLEGHEAAVTAVCFSRGTLLLSTSYDGRICLWDAVSGQCVEEHKTTSCYGALAENGRYVVTGTCDGRVHLWDGFRWDAHL